MQGRSHDDVMAEWFRDDPAFAAHYLNTLLQEGELDDLRAALRQMALAYKNADESAGTASQLYRTLSPKANSEFQRLSAQLNALGLAVQVVPQQPSTV